jgi:hypothetical protein
LVRELGAVLIVGFSSALVYFEWFWNSMWVLAYLRHWIMSFGYYIEVGPLLGFLSFMGGVLALLIALFGFRLLMRQSYSIRRGFVYGLIVGLLGAALSTAMMIAYIYSFDVDLPTITVELFRFLHPLSFWSTLYWVLASIPEEWPFLIGASIGGLLSAVWKRDTAIPTQNATSPERRITRCLTVKSTP